MGNAGNLNCDQRTYIPNNRSSSKSTIALRIKQDLANFRRHIKYMEQANGANSPMIRRVVGKIPHVCVVGAGVAGLRCADILLQHGAKVTILEGRDRVGGRLCQSDALGHRVDLGPNWIHGTDHNPILDLAKQTQTTTMNWDGRQSVFDHLGDHVPEKEAAENIEIVWTIIEQAMKYSNDESATIPADRSLYSYFEALVEKLIPADDEDVGKEEANRKQETVLQMAEMWGAFVGSPIQKQSLKFFWLEECIDGENLFVAETYYKVLQKIAEPSLSKATVEFGHKVKRIVSSQEEANSRVTVDIEGQKSQTFDEVVMTAPLGWLKRNVDAFVPELPTRIQEGINAIGYGHLDKVYITFPTAFWNEVSASPPASSNATRDQSLPNVTATTAPVHQSSLDKATKDPTINPNSYPGFTHWTRPSYALDTNPKHWNQEAVNLAALPGETAHPTLLFYTFGPTSIHLSKVLSSTPVSQHHALLSSYFYPYYSRLPNYSASDADHEPKAILATQWAADELAGYGSYSNFQVGLEEGDKDIEAMRRGVPERGVWLAGEHTAPFVALGTVTGAWWSGEAVAKRIVGAYGLEDEAG